MHRLLKNHLDLDHSADFSTDLIRNSLQNIFKLIVGLVDMAGNSPDQFQTDNEFEDILEAISNEICAKVRTMI
jgi:hypothetical protein